jgi:hypothetical protein
VNRKIDICPRCKEQPKSITKTGRRQPYCRDCLNKISANYNRNHLDQVRTCSSRSNLKRKDVIADWFLRKNYGVGLKDYNRTLKEQDGVCWVCKMPPKESRRLSFDHNHTTDKLRKLLCQKCNGLIGYCNEDVKILENAIQYLREHR